MQQAKKAKHRPNWHRNHQEERVSVKASRKRKQNDPSARYGIEIALDRGYAYRGINDSLLATLWLSRGMASVLGEGIGFPEAIAAWTRGRDSSS
jgi:hypothetical protein